MRSQISSQSLENEGNMKGTQPVPRAESLAMEKVGQHFQRCRVAGLEPHTEQDERGPQNWEKRAALS